MLASLRDLRLLYLASRIEDSLEGLERAYDRHLPEGSAREALQPIFKPGPAHKRLEEALANLNEDIEAQRADITADDLLQAILDCEELAAAFYQRYAGELTDPALRELFLAMSREEAGHVKAVRTAMAIWASGKT